MLLQLVTQSLDLTTPQIMGILNITPDSMFDGGYYMDVDAAVARTAVMIQEEKRRRCHY
jgi:dihydropteroate synthase